MGEEKSGWLGLEDLEKFLGGTNIRDGWACETCLFFKEEVNPDGTHTSKGECRRTNPRPKLATLENSDYECSKAVWAEVRISDWCGEYIRRRFQ